MQFLSEEIKSILKGAIDLHMHGSPDVVPRIGSDLQLAQSAQSAGMRAVLLKSHVTPTSSRAQLVQEAVGGELKVFGGLALNKAIGGLNVQAVETELKLGAKEIWMPTISAVNHVKLHNKNIEEAVPIFDEKGKLLPELFEILELIAKYDVILGTGHLSARETKKLLPYAKERQIKKILVTHPESRLINMSLELQQELAKKGVFFERCFYQIALKPPRNLSPEMLLEQIRGTGPGQTILATDFGQSFNDLPVLGMQKYLKILLDLYVNKFDIERMVKINPSNLLGL